MDPERLDSLATQLLDACRRARIYLVTAESCTGGLIAATLTDIAGSSDVVERGLVTYSDAAKTELLGVAPALIAAHGAVSAAVARAMAEGALARTPQAGLALSVTGIAGPGGATPAKPIGLVYLGAARRGRAAVVEKHLFKGDRRAVRLASVEQALLLGLGQAGPA